MDCAMSRTTTLAVRLSGGLSGFVAANVGENGSYENVSEYIRDLIRRDEERADAQGFDRLKAEFAHANAAPDSSYAPLTAAQVIARHEVKRMKDIDLPPIPADVAAAFDAFPEAIRRRLLDVRRLLFQTADETEGVGPLTETLKWGEPAYLTLASGSGSTIRLGRAPSSAHDGAVLFNCRTTLVEAFRGQFPDVFRFEKNRAILLGTATPLPETELSICLRIALTYHKRR
jgi:Arc/MetJ-type ribon-helix-helix transcriptional regulator